MNKFSLIFIAILLTSCGIFRKRNMPKEDIDPVASKKETKFKKIENKISKEGSYYGEYVPVNRSNMPYEKRVKSYIDEFNGISMLEMIKYGIPASITLAQGILESGAGMGTLAKRSNNHFGIKCHTNWTGGTIEYDDDEKGECFRTYYHPNKSYEDHSLFLKNRKRYNSLFSFKKDDYRAWAKGLKREGYATDPNYANKLIRLIETYNLHKYDSVVFNRRENHKIHKEIVKNTEIFHHKNLPQQKVKNSKNRVTKTHIVKEGDTLYSLSKKYNISIETIRKLNGIEGSSIHIDQELILR